jgi:hypothetical protein
MDDHVAQHNDASDALAAIAAKVGESGTEDTSTLWYKAEHVDTDQIVDGAVTREKLLAAVENSLIPAGTVQDFVGETVPTGWLALEGQTIANADTTYPELWAIAPASWKSGTSLTLADARGKYFYHGGVSDTVGSIVGSNSHQLTNAPLHQHTVNYHSHTVSSNALFHNHSGGHYHNFSAGVYSRGNNITTYNYGFNMTTTTAYFGNNSVYNSGNSNITSNYSNAAVTTIYPTPASNTNSVSNQDAVNIPISYIVFKKIIKAH